MDRRFYNLFGEKEHQLALQQLVDFVARHPGIGIRKTMYGWAFEWNLHEYPLEFAYTIAKEGRTFSPLET